MRNYWFLFIVAFVWTGNAYAAPSIVEDLTRHKRCTKVECDQTQALSTCMAKSEPCHPHHEEAPIGLCTKPDTKCCRIACGGPGSYCLHSSIPCHAKSEDSSEDCHVPDFRCCIPTRSTK